VSENVVSGDKIGLAVELDESEMGGGLGEGEQTFGGGSRGFFGSQNFSPFSEFLLSSFDVPIGINKSGFNVLDGSACSFSQLLYEIHVLRGRR